MIAFNSDNFLTWFPTKNFNWIYNWMATGWHTESRYPLTSEKLALKWADPESVVGVRFQSKTRYALLDIDSGSLYHPQNSNDDHIYKLAVSLESIGINQLIWVRSSNSGGLHAYLPFPETVPTFKAAKLIQQTLQTAGFIIKQGQLEIFPNPKSYSKFQPTNYNGHRLPLQPGTGSCLLNHNQFGGFDEGSTDINYWHFLMVEGSKRQDFKMFKTALKELKIDFSNCIQHYSSTAAKWRQDLEALVQIGWSASGQTNEILFNLLQLGVVFNNLEGEKLTQFMVETAQNMPGYEHFCGHQNEIFERCSDWVKWNETHQKYKPYINKPDRSSPVCPPISSNYSRSIEAREKIARAVQELAGQIFKSSRQLLQAIISKVKELFTIGMSLSTLYKFRNLWQHLLLQPIDESTQTLPDFPESNSNSLSLEFVSVELSPVTPSGCGFLHSSKPPKTAKTSSTSTVTPSFSNEVVCTPPQKTNSKPLPPGVETNNQNPLESPSRSVTVPSRIETPQSNFEPSTSSKNGDNVVQFPKQTVKQRLQAMMGRIKQQHFQVFPDGNDDADRSCSGGNDPSLPVPPLGFGGG